MKTFDEKGMRAYFQDGVTDTDVLNDSCYVF